MKNKFTKFQAIEISDLINLRIETIQCDPDCGTEFENKAGALISLQTKINSGDMDFSESETEFIEEECEHRIEISHGSLGLGSKCEDMSRLAFIRSMRNAISKLY